jgi:hypothetical protein
MSESSPGPVFVDESGRRRRIVRMAGIAVAVLALLYVCLVGVSLFVSPGILSLRLPGVGSLLPNAAAPNVAGGTSPDTPAGQLLRRGTGGSTGGTGAGTGLQQPGTGPTSAPAPTRTATPTPRVTASPTVRASRSATPTPTVTGRSTGSPTAHPTPRGTGQPTARPTHTPGPRP